MARSCFLALQGDKGAFGSSQNGVPDAALRGVAAVPLGALHARAAAARAGGPRAPGAPATIDGLGTVTHRHTLAVEAPLQRDRGREKEVSGCSN